MNKKLLFFLLIPFLGFSQVQIGQDIVGSTNEGLGKSVSMSQDGLILAIGSPFNSLTGSNKGMVKIYKNISNVWTQIGNDIVGLVNGDLDGWSVSLSGNGNIIAISSRNNSSKGSVRIFESNAGNWQQIGNSIIGENIGDNSGESISLSSDGTTIAIGAPQNDDNGVNAGHVRIYKLISGSWVQIGQDIDGKATKNFSGHSVSISSNGAIVAIGAYGNADNGIAAGHTRVFENLNNTWVQIGSDIDGEAAYDSSGYSVSLSDNGNRLAIGAYANDGANGNASGHVRIYENLNNTWIKVGSDIDGELTDDFSGQSVSISGDGNLVAIGAPKNDANGSNSGHVRIYKFHNNDWLKVGLDIDGEATNDGFSSSVVLSGNNNYFAASAPSNDTVSNNAGKVRVYDISEMLSNNEFVQENFNIYPNPTSDILNISLENNLVLEHVTIYNNLGQVVKTASDNVIDVSQLAKGLYFVEVTTNQGKATKKVVIN